MSFTRFDLERIAEGRRDYGHVLALQRGRGALWHSTTLCKLRGILDSGYIVPNDGRFESPWGDYFCRQKGAVCLFDYDTASEEEILSQMYKWEGFISGPFHGGAVWIQVPSERLDAALLTRPSIRNGTIPAGYPLKYFPYVETCHRGPIPVSTFARYLIFGKPAGEIEHREVATGQGTLDEIEGIIKQWKQQAEEHAAARRTQWAARPPNPELDAEFEETMRAARERVERMPREE